MKRDLIMDRQKGLFKIQELEKENTELKALVEKMGEVVEFYGKDENHNPIFYDQGITSIDRDEGALARQLQQSPEYIKHVKGEKDE